MKSTLIQAATPSPSEAHMSKGASSILPLKALSHSYSLLGKEDEASQPLKNGPESKERLDLSPPHDLGYLPKGSTP